MWWLKLKVCLAPDEGSNGYGAPPSGGNAPSPSAPAAPAAPAPSEQPISYIDDAYDNMLADDLPPEQDTWGSRQDSPAAPQPAAPAYPQPVTPPGQRPAAPAAPPRQATPPVAPTPPVPQAAPPAPLPAPGSPEAQRAEAEARMRRDPFGYQADLIQQQTQQYTDALAKEIYPVSTEDIDAFLSGDGTKISQALARVHVNAVGSMLRVVSQQMPVWMNNMMNLHSTARSREDEFWQRNSFLDRNQHGQQALTAARVYRQMYPNADAQTIDRMVGAMVAAAVGVAIPPGHAQPGAAPAAPNAPVTTPYRTPGPVVRRTTPPFQPAGTAAAGARRAPQAGNPWSELADILSADQQGQLDNVT